MRTIWSLVLIAALAACESKPGAQLEANGQKPDPQGIRQRLLAGDTALCRNPAVISDALGAIIANNSGQARSRSEVIKKAWEQEKDGARWTSASTAGFEDAIHEVTCQGTLQVSSHKLAFTFSARPSANNNTIIYASGDVGHLLNILTSNKVGLR